MNQLIRFCMLSLMITLISACGGGGGEDSGNNNQAPSINSVANPSVPENTTAVITVTATDADGDSPAFSITGGADAAQFSIVNATGVLTFIAAPDFENPTDDDDNNIYELQVTADDGNGGTAVQNIAVTVSNNGIDAPPGIYGGTITATAGIAHNATGLITSNGKLAIIDLNTFEVINGTISDSSITGRVLAPPSSAALTGTITSAAGNNITGTYTSTLGDGSFSLDANSSLYTRGASFAKLLGTWVDSVYTGGTGTTTWVFQNDGSYVMTSTESCTGSGNFYLIDATKNEYEMDLALSNCTNASINGNYTGIGTMSDTSHTDDTLTFMFINAAGTVGGLFEPIKQ